MHLMLNPFQNNRLYTFALGFLSLLCPLTAQESTRQIPDPLKSWQDWATWDDAHRRCPTPYFDSNQHLCFWPSQLDLKLDDKSGQFELGLTVYHETWIPLLRSNEVWPFDVKANGTPVPVVNHDDAPSVQLKTGTYRLTGNFHWNELPQRLAIAQEIGVLTLSVNGKRVDNPAWDAEGYVWLKRSRSESEIDKDFLAVKVYRVIEDGIPMWLRTVVELSVSGKSREEKLGSILPEGWQISSVDSPIPVSVDDKGLLKTQVRAGKWLVRIDSFRLNHAASFQYPSGSQPVSEEELVAFRSQPDLRMVEVRGVPSIDATQTTFPNQWRSLPVYRWETKNALQLEERMRGMGLQKPEGLQISRELWLDDNGRAFTFRDAIRGHNQQIWRLDAAENQNLGSVRSAGQGQLITRNPKSNAPGVELRSRELNLEATGRMNHAAKLSATGWQADADSLRVSLNLPAGWRLFALFGADYVHGDWITAWSLLDLFLLLVFALAVYKLCGWQAGLIAFLAYALAYREPNAPRYVWLALLVPLALQRVALEGKLLRVVLAAKYLAIAWLVIALTPFVTKQIQSAIYPQLESRGGFQSHNDLEVFDSSTASESFTAPATAPTTSMNDQVDRAPLIEDKSNSFLSSTQYARRPKSKTENEANFQYDTKARIQTGPGVPDWSWRSVSFGWNGPVKATQQFHPILLPPTVVRLLTLIRVGLLLALAAVLLGARDWKVPDIKLLQGAHASLLAALFGGLTIGLAPTSAQAQIPDEKLLKTLHDRLLKTSDAYPNAADIPSVAITLRDRLLTIDTEIHTATATAVPLPGRLPAWSPVRITVDGKTDAAVRRFADYLWVALPPGVHRVHIEGQLANTTEWEWAFQLKPHRVTIDAPGWTYTGVNASGVPESQIFFAQKQRTTSLEASYERQDLRTVAVLERQLELGLVWQVHNTVRRLCPPGRALSLRIPLLPGEKVLSDTEAVKDGCIEVRLGAQESQYEWDSELTITDKLQLTTRANDAWVELWRLAASPVWNVTFDGLAPVFAPGQSDLIPVWQPWPGERVTLAISRPQAVNGATVTVQSVSQKTHIGDRQRRTHLSLKLQCSLGEDFALDLPNTAEITSLTQNGQVIPVRQDGTKLVIPLRPGTEQIDIHWKTNGDLGTVLRAEAVCLPTESANIGTALNLPQSRWILWTHGPLRGPAVRLWGVLAVCLLGAWLLSRLAFSPLRARDWMLLIIGLTQIPLPLALITIGWFFLLVLRGQEGVQKLNRGLFHLFQFALAASTLAMLLSLFCTVYIGLLGKPDMFIAGNGSSATNLRWFLARADQALPQPLVVSVSIWWYRLIMLLWALWLASSLLRWLKWGWNLFSLGGLVRPKPLPPRTPPPLP